LKAGPFEPTTHSAVVLCQVHDQVKSIAVERRQGAEKWERIGTLVPATPFVDKGATPSACYRARAISDAGESAYSNIACINR